MSKTHSPNSDRVTIIAVATTAMVVLFGITTIFTVSAVMRVKSAVATPISRSVVDGPKIERVYTSLAP